MITEPRLHLIFGQDLPAGRNKEQDILKEYIVKDSVEQNSVFCKDLKSSSDTVSLLLEKNCPTILDFLCVEEPVQAVLYDGLTTVYTGYVSASYSWVIGHTGAKTFKVTLENKATKLLSVPYIEVGYNSLDGKVSDIIQSICDKTGLEISSETQIPDYSVCRAISSEDTCKSILTDILYEGGWVYRFDQNGKLVFYEISFSDTTDVTVSSDDLAVVNNNAITLTKKARQHSGAAIEYQAIARKKNVLVYSCTTGRDEGHPFCNLVIPGKNFFNGGEISSQYAKLYVEAVNAGSDAEISNGEILTIYNARIVKQTAYGGLTESVESSGKYLCIKAENTGGTDKAYYRFDVYADVLYVASTDKILSGTIKDPVREAFRYVHDKAIAEKHARLLDKYSSVSGQNYTFQTTRDILLGSVIKLIDSKISHIEVSLFIYSKKETKSPYYQYQGVPVSNIRQSELVHETTSPSKNPSYITPSAYREAVANGYKGTESEWLKSVSKNLKYIWSSSDTEVVTQKSSYWKFAGKWMMYGRGLIGDIHEKDWLDTWDKVMQERTDEYCYLWAKVGDDGQPFLFQGVSPMDFSVVFSPSAYIINPRELSGKQITITLTRLNGIKGASTATLIDNPAGITIEESETDVWIAYVASSPATALSFSVKITCGAVEKVYSVTGMMSSTQNMCAGYFTDSLPSSGESMNYITGDTALLNGKPYKYTGDGWSEITSVDEYETLPYQLAVDTGDCMLANGDITESLGVMWGYFGHIFAKAALIERIRTSNITMEGNGIIRSKDVLDGHIGDNQLPVTGYALDGQNGRLQSNKAFIANANVVNATINTATLSAIRSDNFNFGRRSSLTVGYGISWTYGSYVGPFTFFKQMVSVISQGVMTPSYFSGSATVNGSSVSNGYVFYDIESMCLYFSTQESTSNPVIRMRFNESDSKVYVSINSGSESQLSSATINVSVTCPQGLPTCISLYPWNNDSSNTGVYKSSIGSPRVPFDSIFGKIGLFDDIRIGYLDSLADGSYFLDGTGEWSIKLPGKKIMKWKYLYRTGDDSAGWRTWTFATAFPTGCDFAFAVPVKSDQNRDAYYYGYMGALSSTYVNFSTWGLFDYFCIAIGS